MCVTCNYAKIGIELETPNEKIPTRTAGIRYTRRLVKINTVQQLNTDHTNMFRAEGVSQRENLKFFAKSNWNRTLSIHRRIPL